VEEKIRKRYIKSVKYRRRVIYNMKMEDNVWQKICGEEEKII
jgi:hypothetical protein